MVELSDRQEMVLLGNRVEAMVAGKIKESLRMELTIMAKKSKGFGELLHQQQRLQRQQESMDQLAKRVQENLKDKVVGVVDNPPGEAKMSEVLQAFVAPYLDSATHREQRLKLFAIAVVAWNLALLPEDQQQPEMEEMIHEIVKDRQAQQDTRAILEELVERKRRLFPDNQRYVLDFELQETRHDFHLSVISLPESKDAK